MFETTKGRKASVSETIIDLYESAFTLEDTWTFFKVFSKKVRYLSCKIWHFFLF